MNGNGRLTCHLVPHSGIHEPVAHPSAGRKYHVIPAHEVVTSNKAQR